MSGTDKTKAGHDLAGPVVILVEPQLGENIGMVARAMANFGLAELRLVNPRDGWPSEKARAAASRADSDCIFAAFRVNRRKAPLDGRGRQRAVMLVECGHGAMH